MVDRRKTCHAVSLEKGNPMRSRDLIKLLSGETGVPDRSDSAITFWRNAQGQLHRDFGPAVVWNNGTQSWYRNGQLHRDGGPAISYANGKQVWYRNGQLHREDGPAVIKANGLEEWYRNGERIR